MALFDEPSLEASASPGLPPLPAQGAAAQPLPPAPPAGLGFDVPAPQPQAGLGMAPQTPPPPASADTEEQQYLQSLPVAQKLGLALQAFSAGVAGQPNPINTILEQRRKAKATMKAELGENMRNLGMGMEILDKLQPGSRQYTAMSEMLARKMPDFAGAFQGHGQGRSGKVRAIASVLSSTEAQDVLVKASGGDPATAQRLLADGDFVQKMLIPAADGAALPVALAKIKSIANIVRQLPGPEMKDADGKVVFTMADLYERNKQLPPELKLSDGQLQAVARNQTAAVIYGMKTDKTLQVEQEALARKGEQEEKAPQTINVDGKVYQFDPENKSAAARLGTDKRYALLGKGQSAALAADQADTGLSPEAVDMTARNAMKDRLVLAGLGRGVQGAKDLRAVLNRMAEISKESGVSAPDARADFNANKKSLDKIIPQFDAVEAFTKNAVLQGRVLTQLAEKVDNTGLPVLERWIRGGQRAIVGDADVSVFDAQMQLYRTEVARILTNPNLTGQLTDTARKEVEHFLSGNATAPQISAIVKRLEQDFALRRQSIEEQVAEIKGRMADSGADRKGAKKPTAAAPTGPYADPEKERRYQEWKARQAK
jgi:hypothetical protein